jgi:hypothetical protein
VIEGGQREAGVTAHERELAVNLSHHERGFAPLSPLREQGKEIERDVRVTGQAEPGICA